MKLIINEFRGIKNITIELNQLTVIVGDDSNLKHTCLDIIRFFSNMCNKKSFNSTWINDIYGKDMSFSLRVSEDNYVSMECKRDSFSFTKKGADLNVILIEYPEKNLHPKRQIDEINSISSGSKVFNGCYVVTTHSHYILTGLDNLIQAKEVSELAGIERLWEEINIPRRCWIAFDKVSVFQVHKDRIENIMDFERKAIDTSKIDDVSEEIGKIYDTLLKYKYPNNET